MIRFITVAAALCVAVSAASADNVPEPKFETDIRSILKTHCFQCHGEEDDPAGGLDLRLVRLMLRGGDSGAAIVVGQPDQSLLLQRLRDGEMPPDEGTQLKSAEIDVIQNWIAAGAHTARPEPESVDLSTFITEEERAHWAFQPITRPAVPEITAGDSVNNPIDAFLLARLEAHGAGFSPQAPPHTLLRRIYLDLHGLPPTPAAVSAFVSSDHAAAWPVLVDELLESQRYGERWASHWLDVAGYADSEGFNEADQERPSAWRYRDYVIRSLNADKPLDQFITEQLAGDELISTPLTSLSDTDAELLTATGYLRMAPDGTGGSVPDPEVARNATIADTIKIVSSSLLGMTVACAECHDHRYDPVSQVDYYRFRAIFEPAFDWQQWRKPAERRISLYTDQDRAAAALIEEQAKKIDDERTRKQNEFIQATFEKQLAELPPEIHEAARIAHQTSEKDRTDEQKSLFRKHPNLNVTAGSLYLYDQQAADQLKQMSTQAQEIRDTKPKEEFVRALTEVPGRIPATHLFYRGDHQQPKQELQPGGLTVISQSADLSDIPSRHEDLPTTGRRLALAKQLTSPNHPLTARVMVNRVWLHHFGQGLVTTPGDFGLQGQPPTHPELLDWLAAELIDSGWSLKHLHRLILGSRAWQQQLNTDAELQQLDPDNQLYGGARLLRLDAEVIRNSMLAIAGKLNDKPFGPAVPVMADRVGRFVVGQENLNAGRPGDLIDMQGEQFRRSIYLQVRRSRPLSVLDAFDRPAMSPNCELRRPSTTATQSLMMLNSDLLLEYSRHLAERLHTEAGDDPAQRIRLAWMLVYARQPEHSELETADRFLQDETAIFAEQPAYQPDTSQKPDQQILTAAQEATAVMCQMLFSSNEFLYLN